MTQIAREVDQQMQQMDPQAAAVLEQEIRRMLEAAARPKPPVPAERWSDLPVRDLKPLPGIDFSRIGQNFWDY